MLTISESTVTIVSIPVSKAYVPSIIGRHSTAVDDDAEDDEANDGNDLDYSQDKLDYIFHQYSIKTWSDSTDLHHNLSHQRIGR
jgi:hypothetical protein